MTFLVAAFFLTAMLYASVGFGGGSTYIALLIFVGVATAYVPVVAPICNIVVVTGGAIRFWRAGLVPWRRVLPLVVASAPLAYLGGLTPVTERVFVAVLGGSLLVAGVLLLAQPVTESPRPASRTGGAGLANARLADAGLGGAIGYMSGLVGIGGGIFLAPVQHLIRWATAPEIAATASVFILVNSVAGLSGQLTKLGPGALPELAAFWPLVAAVLVGGQIGTHAGIRLVSHATLRRATGILIVYVAGQLLWRTFAG